MYDTIIIGCGPAGLTAAIYLRRANKKVLILEQETIGGQISSSPLIENYPGYDKISGASLSEKLFDQAINLGCMFELEKVIKIEKDKVITEENTYQTKTILIATGSKYRLLKIENEDKYLGKGIHFCVACDGAFYKDEKVAVIGGGNSGVINALELSNIANHVYLVQDIDHLTGEESRVNQVLNNSKIEVIYNAKVTKILGEETLSKIIVNDDIKLDVKAMFLAIGTIPNTNLISDRYKDKYGYIIADDMNVYDNVFTAGDCRSKEIRQITTATSDGTISALKIIDYLNK